MPESNPVRDTMVGAALGFVGSIPGMGVVAGGAQAALAAAARQRDEEWGAMVNARILYLEENGVQIHYSDPEFVAAVHRLTRAAQEASDDTKRRAYASMLANSGPWSAFSGEERERLERYVRELTSHEILVLHVFRDPRAWWEQQEPGAPATYERQTIMSGIDDLFNGPIHRLNGMSASQGRAAADELGRRGLASIPYTTSMGPDGILAKRSTGLGDRLLQFIGEAEHS